MHSSAPSIDGWLSEVKRTSDPDRVGMVLVHNGVVRGTTRSGAPVAGMKLDVDRDRLEQTIVSALAMPGIADVRAWVNEGLLLKGDDIMRVLVVGDIRENVFAALQHLVGVIKSEVVVEQELSEPLP